MIRTIFGLSLGLLALAAACGGGSSGTDPTNIVSPISGTPTSDAASCDPARPSVPGDVTQTVASGGVPRSYVIHIPPNYDGTHATPIVLALHGYAFSGQQMLDYTKLPALADQKGFIVVSPDGTGMPAHWNWRKTVNEPDDVQFVRDLLAKLDADLCTDASRTFVAGFSDGAAMSRILACDLAKRIAAIATVASPGVNCIAPVPMVAFHGTADPLVPFDGGVVPAEVGGGGTFPPVRRALSEWARGLGCDGLATISHPTTSAELSTYVNCSNGEAEALLYTLIGGGHTWPGSSPLPPDPFGATDESIDAISIIWAFFAAHRLVE